MTIFDMIRAFVDMLTTATLQGICIGFWVILLGYIWKWCWRVIKVFLGDMFPRKEDTDDHV